MRFPIPEDILTVMRQLRDAGAKVYIVGGAVRDWLRGMEPKDVDLATSLLPSVVQTLFATERVVATGLKHGTVTIFPRSSSGLTRRGVEITTFRTEESYTDHRRPDVVHFVDDIRADLSRRDFTINAMAYDPFQDRLIDPYDGEGDICRRTVKAVGNPATRFGEDALRIIRAVRFVAELDYGIDPASLEAMRNCRAGLSDVAGERLQAEFSRIIVAPSVEDALRFINDAKLWPYLWPLDARKPGTESEGAASESATRVSARKGWTAQACSLAPMDLPLRLALFLCENGPAVTIDDSQQAWSTDLRRLLGDAQCFMAHLKYSKTVRKAVDLMIEHHATPFEALRDLTPLAHMIGMIGVENIRAAATVRALLYRSKGADARAAAVIETVENGINEIRRRELPCHIRDLAITGADLVKKAGMPAGPLVGQLLRMVQDHIFAGNLANSRMDILTFVEDVYANGISGDG